MACLHEEGKLEMTDVKSGHTSRRTVAKGAAWSVPVIVMGNNAPAMAASPPVVFSHITTWRWYSNNFPFCGGSTRDGLEINTTEGTQVKITDTRPWTTITNVYADFWFRKNDITWTGAPGNSGCWSAPTYDGTAAGGYYRYRSNYTCTITPVTGTTVLQSYRWRTPCYDESDFEYMRNVRRQAYATVNGTVQSTDTGYFQIQS